MAARIARKGASKSAGGFSHEHAERIVSAIERLINARLDRVLNPSAGPEVVAGPHNELVGRLETNENRGRASTNAR